MKLTRTKILDAKLFKYLILYCAICFLITFVSGILSKLEGVKFVDVPLTNMLFGMSVLYLAKFAYILAAIFLVRYLFLKGYLQGLRRFWLHFVAGIGLTFHSVIAQILLYNWLFGLEQPFTMQFIYRNALLGADFNFFLYFSMVAIVYVYYFLKGQNAAEIKESNLKTQLLDAKMNSLQYQLQPHFLFNALNDISSLIDLSKEKSQNAIADLSEMLRETLSLKDIKFISLEKELTILKKYLDIEKMRFDDKLNYRIHIDDQTNNQKVPPLILQPIVENSIKHGFSYQCDHLKIDITAKKVNNQLELKVSNTGALLENDMANYGTGINNVINRLETIYEGNFEFQLKNLANGEGVMTRIRIPPNPLDEAWKY